MIVRNSAVPDNIFELQRQDLVGNYARSYKDEIARKYEDLNIIFVPYFPLNIDLDFFRAITFPEVLKKVGVNNGIEKSLIARDGAKFFFDQNHLLLKAFPDALIAAYLQSQIVSVDGQIKAALHTLFPKYYSLMVGNITWRMTETVNEGMHIDGFLNGEPTPPEIKGRLHRIKLFINIDTVPRKWWTSYKLPEILKRFRGHLPDTLPDDADMIAYKISRGGFLDDAPHHEIDIPPMGAVMGEAQAIAHAVRYGRRMIAAEFMCLTEDMLDPGMCTQARVPGWLADAGIGVSQSVDA